jgi:hypothetical protein
MTDFEKLREPLSVKHIDFRVQSINKGGYATILAYKDARVDMQRLDEAVGPENWMRSHNSQNHNCVVSIWCDKKKQWIAKEDTGTESMTEAQKGLASDSFKRACFNWGIGRELYDYPLIQVKLNGDGKGNNGDDEWRLDGQRAKQHWGLRLKEWTWFTEFNGHKKLTMLLAKDHTGKIRYEWRDVEQVRPIAEELILMITEERFEEMCEAWAELEVWEEHLLMTAKTKGGFFDTEQKKLIKTKLFEYHNQEQAA